MSGAFIPSGTFFPRGELKMGGSPFAGSCISLEFYHYINLNEGHHRENPKESSQEAIPRLPETLKALEKLKLSSGYL